MGHASRFAALCLLLPATAIPAGAAETGQGGCDNYGTIVQVGIGNDYECTHMTQHCDQGTGAGAGAGAGGPGQNEAGASATAGTQCNQDGDASAALGPGVGPLLDGLHVDPQEMLPWGLL
jgi:hypothetical protein